MKNVLYKIGFVIFISLNAFSQEEDFVLSDNIEGVYNEIPDIELNKFKGLWVYLGNGGESFKIRIDVEKKVFITRTKHFIDRLVACFCFDENSNCTNNSQKNNFGIGFTEEDLFGEIIFLHFQDPVTTKSGIGRFKIISYDSATWEVSSAHSLFNNNQKKFSIPENVKLTRISN